MIYTQTLSPLIANGQLNLTNSGDLVNAPDIQTQMTVTLSAYHCIYNTLINSGLLPYLKGIPTGGINTVAIKNIVTSAYQILIQQNIITNLSISIVPVSQSYLTINISAESMGSPVTLSWDNTNL